MSRYWQSGPGDSPSDPRLRILLLGASGFVGGGLWRHLAARHEVVGTFANRAIPGLVQLDLRDERRLRALAADGFDLVIHAAGLVPLEAAEADPELAHRLNVRPVEVLLAAVRDSAAKLVFFSSDNVFDGSRHQYTEDDLRSPVNVYGRTKTAAEDLLLADGGHLVVRIPLVFGRGPWANSFLARLAGPTTPARTDLVCAPVYLPSLGPALAELWARTGVVHFGGRDVVTRFELMSKVQQALDLPTRVVAARGEEAASRCRRPPRLVLRSTRHRLLGPGLDAALAHLAGRSPA
ncbi:sugar nucleotide-binding protein [Kitasatospora sp. RB6PN24]|uniref:SDR family oxidoreductase n=1 Tax=Kitasatospora humi TaxID=2893891 RepID=UPI001E3C94ED|nr:sugar nucleotide-binding protein [Kitasatospora humi]MCC9305887.1 sugar nucleotide-binding protein [Kitasatospora humi]